MKLLFTLLSSLYYVHLIICKEDIPMILDVPLLFETKENISCPDPNTFSCNNILLDLHTLTTKEYVKIFEQDVGYILLKRKLHWKAKHVHLLEFTVLMGRDGIETHGYLVITVNEIMKAYYGFFQHEHLKMSIISKLSFLNGYVQRWTQALPYAHGPSRTLDNDQILPPQNTYM